MNTILTADILTSSDYSSIDQKDYDHSHFSVSNSYFNFSDNIPQSIANASKVNNHILLKSTKYKEKNQKNKTNGNKIGLNDDINQSLSSDEILLLQSDLQKKLNNFQSKKTMANNEIPISLKLEQKIRKDLKVEYSSDSGSQNKFLGINARKNSKKIEKYIYAISSVDEEIHKCIQSIDSKTSYLNQSKTELLKIENKADQIRFKIDKEKKQHEIMLKKYKNQFKFLAKERNEVKKLAYENPVSKYRDEQSMIKRYSQVHNSRQELTSELKFIKEKKLRSNNRLERMECQLQRLIRAESNLKKKSKKISKRDKKEAIITSLLDKLESKLKDKQIKKDKEFRRGQIETQILLQTFGNIQQTIQREENNQIGENIYLPDFPVKLIQNKNQREENITKISDELNVVQNDIKLLKREIQKLRKTNEKYQNRIFELNDRQKCQKVNNNYTAIYHNENVNVIYKNANHFMPCTLNEINQLSFDLDKKRDEVEKRKRKMLTKYEKYLSIVYEYGKKWQE